MVFHADMAFALELIALVAGTALLVGLGKKEEVCCRGFAKVVAYFTIVVAVLTLLCTSYYTLRFWEDGHFGAPHVRPYHHMRGYKDYPCDCPMMKRMKGAPGECPMGKGPRPGPKSSVEE